MTIYRFVELIGARQPRTDRGTLAPGERADFIVMDANPLGNMSSSRKISAVYRNGMAIDRAALERALRREG